MEYEAYEDLRKVTCSELGLTYRPDPIKGEHKTREVVQPEDKLKAGMKERIVASVVAAHERVEEAVDKRLKYEDRSGHQRSFIVFFSSLIWQGPIKNDPKGRHFFLFVLATPLFSVSSSDGVFETLKKFNR